MSDHDKPTTLIRATPALLDGWCGPVVLLWGGAPVPYESVALGGRIIACLARPVEVDMRHPDCETMSIHLDLARPEVQDRVCRVLCGHPEVELRVHIAWTFVIIAHAWGSPIVASCSLPGRHVPTIPALATCATLPEALAVWWAHDQETP